MGEIDSRQKILEAAKELFYRKGYSATTMRMIAQASQTSIGLPSYYFGSKESLGVTVYKEFRQKLNQVCRMFYPSDRDCSEYRYFSVISDAALLVENQIYRDLYAKTANHADMGEYMVSMLADIHPEQSALRKYQYLNALTVLAVKAILINADLEKNKITPEELIEFIFRRYLRMQEPERNSQWKLLFQRYYRKYQECGFRILEKFDLEYDTEQLEKHRQNGFFQSEGL